MYISHNNNNNNNNNDDDDDNWRVSGVSKTLSGVIQLKIGDICIICLDACMSFLYFDPGIFVFSWQSTPFQTSLNRILTLLFLLIIA